MRALRVPRSGGMILSMMTALVAVMLLPVVFMAALSNSADAHPRGLGAELQTLAQPVVTGLHKLVDRLKR